MTRTRFIIIKTGAMVFTLSEGADMSATTAYPMLVLTLLPNLCSIRKERSAEYDVGILASAADAAAMMEKVRR